MLVQKGLDARHSDIPVKLGSRIVEDGHARRRNLLKRRTKESYLPFPMLLVHLKPLGDV
jgi:hypothetical protein